VNDGTWQSLCEVDRKALSSDHRRVLSCLDHLRDTPREGYVDLPIQTDPTKANSDQIAVARDFVHWAGSSAVVADPLDRLGQVDNHDSEGETNHQGLAKSPALEEVVRKGTLPALRYGNVYAFSIRKVAMSGMGPLPGMTHGGRPDARQDTLSQLAFKRTIEMAPPKSAALLLPDQFRRAITEAPAVSEAESTGTGESVISGIYIVLSRTARVQLRSRPPLAHWRVALHARGASGLEDDAIGYPEFEDASTNFALRVRRADQFRNEHPGSSAVTTEEISHLLAVDPHLAGVELTSRVWYPFSDTPTTSDRFVVSGNQRRMDDDIARKRFTDLIVDAEKLIEGGDLPLNFSVKVAEPEGLKARPSAAADPVLYRGFRNRIESLGIWQESIRNQTIWPSNSTAMTLSNTALPKRAPDGREMWSANLIVFGEQDGVPIGGALKSGIEPDHKVVLRYSGLSPLINERTLELPPVDQPNVSPTPKQNELAPVRGTVLQWRRYFFASQSADDLTRKAYEAFLESKLNATCHRDDANRQDLEIVVNNSYKESQLVAPAFSFPSVVSTKELLGQDNAVSRIICTLGRYKDKDTKQLLPFVEDDITWVVRLSWRFPLTNSHLSRPRDLAAVKEFHLYRKDKGDREPCPGESPRAILRRPSDGVFRELQDDTAINHLDKIEWTWLDTVQDRAPHSFQYYIVAVPEFTEAFSEQLWLKVEVTIPSSQIDTKPSRAVALPMLSRTADQRRVSLYFPEDHSRLTDCRVAFRISAVQADPLLPSNDASYPRTLVWTKPRLEDVFPAKGENSEADVKEGWLHERPENEPVVDGFGKWNFTTLAAASDSLCSLKQTADIPPCDSQRPGGREKTARVFSCELKDDEAARDRVISVHTNPFLKLQICYYSEEPYPRLKQAAASDVLETDWLQCYPEDLASPVLDSHAYAIRCPSVWTNGKGAPLLFYRFHIYVVRDSQSPGPAFHLSTVDSKQPILDLQTFQKSFEAKLKRYVDGPPDHVVLYVRSEEGILTNSFGVDDDGKVLKTPDNPDQSFVILRGSKETLRLDAIRDASVWKFRSPTVP
jgi:hypothetical protein